MKSLIEKEYEKLKQVFNEVNQEKNIKLLGLDKENSLLQNDWEYFKNTIGAIDSVVEQSKELKFIGFIGHSGAGKSSLLNAIMNIQQNENPLYKREVGETFTDKGITLIVHPENSDKIQKSNYTNSQYFNIVEGPADDYFKNIVLVDTPGLGNEEIERKVLESFLHMCNLIVLTLNGERPFGNKNEDFALLDLKLNKLEGIPTIFAITNAEHFVHTTYENNQKTINFDKGLNDKEIIRFWDEVLTLLIEDSRFENDKDIVNNIERFFVDSNARFNIIDIKNAIQRISSGDTNTQKVEEARINYFKHIGKDVLLKFKTYLSQKRENFKEILDGANKKKDSAYSNIDGELNSVKQIIDSVKKSQIDSINEAEKKLEEKMEFITINVPFIEFNDYLVDIRQYRKNVLEKVYKYFENYNAKLGLEKDTLEKNKEALIHFDLKEYLISEKTNTNTFLFSEKLKNTIKNYWKLSSDETMQQLISNQKSMKARINKKGEFQRIKNNQAQILEQVDKFIDTMSNYIDLYRDYVITPNNRQLFKEIGEILPEDFNRRVIEKDNNIVNRLKNIENNIDQSTLKKLTVNVLDEKNENTNDQFSKTNFQIDTLSQKLLLSNHFIDKVIELFNTTKTKIFNNINQLEQNTEQLQDKIKSIKSARISLFKRGGIVTLILSLIFFLGEEFLNTQFIEGLIQNGIVFITFTLISFTIIGFKDNQLKTVFTSIKDYEKELDKDITNYKVLNMEVIKNFKEQLERYITNTQEDSTIIDHFTSLLKNTEGSKQFYEYKKILEETEKEYLNQIILHNNSLTDVVDTLIDDLKKFSQQAKQKSIEPLMNSVNEADKKVSELVDVLNKQIEIID